MENKQNQPDSMDTILQMMEMMKNLKSSKDQQTRQTAEELQKEYSASFDDSLHTPAMRSIKAALPYIEPSYRRILGMLVKCMELQAFTRSYAMEGMRSQQETGENWKRGMLTAMRPHMPPEKQSQVDFLLQLIDMQDMMQLVQTMQRGDWNGTGF